MTVSPATHHTPPIAAKHARLLPATDHHIFLEKEDDPWPLHLDDAYDHFINYSHSTLQSDTIERLKPPSKQQTVATPIQLMKGRR